MSKPRKECGGLVFTVTQANKQTTAIQTAFPLGKDIVILLFGKCQRFYNVNSQFFTILPFVTLGSLCARTCEFACVRVHACVCARACVCVCVCVSSMIQVYAL